MSRPPNSFLIPPSTPISTTQSQKAQNDPKIGQKYKRKIKQCLENDSFFIYEETNIDF